MRHLMHPWWVVLGLLLWVATGVHAAVREGYKMPTVTVGYAWQKPAIDGVITDQEWGGATSMGVMQTVTKMVSPRTVQWWLMWDEAHLYVAMRGEMREGERPIQANRRTDKDAEMAVFDDSYEMWWDLGSRSPDGQPVIFQYLTNVAGARLDVMHEPAVGNARRGWTAGWDIKSRVVERGGRRVIEMEAAIPVKSMYKEKLSAGEEIRGLLARNFKRPWEQCSVEGTGSFAVADTYTRWVLSKEGAVAQLLGVGDAKAGTFGVNLALTGREAGRYRWTFQDDAGVSESGVVEAQAGQATRVEKAGLGKTGKGDVRIKVTTEDGSRVLVDWCAQERFGDPRILEGDPQKNGVTSVVDKGDVVKVGVTFNPVRDYVRVTGDFIQFDQRGQIARSEVVVRDGAEKEVARQELRLDPLAYGEAMVRLPGLGLGKYSAKLTCYDQAGGVLAAKEEAFEKKDPAQAFVWWNTKVGDIEKVISPWTAMTWDGKKVGMWGREMEVGAAGLPASVTSQGAELLAGPGEVVAGLADGREVKAGAATVKLVSQAAHRVVVQASSMLGTMRVGSEVSSEFDGMYQVRMTLTPSEPMKVTRLQVKIPLKGEVAEYIHGTGEGIRSGYYYGFVPKEKTGRVWDCRTVDSQPMLVGSFIPYLWVGNTQAGLCWFADSDEGWVPNNEVPAVELVRGKGGEVALVLNLVSSACVLDQPRTVTFGLQATPVKPLHQGWRMDSWWCGDTFKDWAQVEKKGGNLIFTSIPFTLDPEACRKMVEAAHRGTALGLAKYRANAVPYFIHQALPAFLVPEAKYFGEEWKTAVSEGLVYGPTLTDYMIYHLGTWAKECGIDGFYVDNMRPLACDNLDAGRGYRLPDGRVQPTYQMFDTRRYFLRMRAAFAEQGKQGKIILHMTNNMIIPWVGAADIAYDGEDKVIYPEMGKDFMDMWSLERVRVDLSAPWGTAVNFMNEYQGNWEKSKLKQAVRAYTGMILLHDALPSGNHNSLNLDCWAGRDRFGIEADDVRFVGYWQKDAGVESQAKDVKCAAWVRPGKVLLAVVNFGEKTEAGVKIVGGKLGLGDVSQAKVWDAETQEVLAIRPDGSLVVPVGRHDYRQVVIEMPAK